MSWVQEYATATAAQKAKITRNWNELIKRHGKETEKEYAEWRVALDTHAPIRDAKIEEAEARYEEIVAKAKAEFNQVKAEAYEEFKKKTSASERAYDAVRDASWDAILSEHKKFAEELVKESVNA